MSVFDTLPAEIANSPTEFSISLQTCCKSKKVDDTSSEILIVLLNNSCGCSEDGHFSGRIGGVKLPRPLGLQRQRCGNVQVQERNRYRTGTERNDLVYEDPEATEDPEAPQTNILLDTSIR